MLLDNFSSSDGDVPESYLNTPKRRIIGKAKQVQCVPISAILGGFDATGAIAITSGSKVVTGTGTSFLQELSPADELILSTDQQTYKFNVQSINSDTEAILSSESETALSSSDFVIKPKRPYRLKNRNWHIAGHKLRAPTTTITKVDQVNRFNVNDDSDFFANDLINVNGESAYIRRINSNRVVLESALQTGLPSIGDTVSKNPISKSFVNGSEIFINRDWSLTNTISNAILTLDSLVEFNVAPIIDLNFNLSFTNSSREITVSGTDLTSQFQTRDWIRSQDINHTTWYEILEVDYDNDTNISTVKLRVPYAGTTNSLNAQKKNVDLIDDDSIITVNCFGLELSNAWVKTASDAVKAVLENDAGFTNINTSSFTESDNDAPFILSYVVPRKIGGNNITIRDFISDINKTVFGSLILDNNFDLKYQILTPEKPTDLVELKDDDLVNNSIVVTSRNEIVRKVNAKYNPFADKFNGNEAFDLYEFSNDFVDSLIGIKTELDLTIYLAELNDVVTIAQRYAFYNSLSQSKFTLSGKLNLISKELNSKILINLDRLYKRFGNKDKRKIAIVNAVKNNGSDVVIEVNDLGNAFNRGAAVSADSANNFSTASNDEKILYSYVCDDDTLTPSVNSDSEIYQNLIC